MDTDASDSSEQGRRIDETSMEDEAGEIVLAGSDLEQQEPRSIKRQKQPSKTDSGSSFWKSALSGRGNLDLVPPSEEIDSVPEKGTTEMVEFMESERSKDARKGEAKDDGSSKKKNKAILEDDEAVWGANSAMGPHFQDNYDDDMAEDI